MVHLMSSRGEWRLHKNRHDYGNIDKESTCSDHLDFHLLRSRNALPITDTELKLIAAAANIGLNVIPNNGNKAPPAIGIPIAL